MNDRFAGADQFPSEILSTTPELMREGAAITGVTADEVPQDAYLVRSEAVAKFSSFRQVIVSTINKFSSVTAVTYCGDGGHQVL
ncbi:MAG TPA: hypothetical protein VMG82_03000 [Candidatus Sulfotelmatobacter sp.]|nr:hypothetical protein [Candidatus Sulfotelmatobacter sp.]